MSRHLDGTTTCDCCDSDVGNAAVTECAIVVDTTTAADGSPSPRQLHFCKQPHTGHPNGCHAALLRPSMLGAYTARQEASP